MDGKIYRINEEVELEEGKKQNYEGGGKNDKNCGGGGGGEGK